MYGTVAFATGPELTFVNLTIYVLHTNQLVKKIEIKKI